MAEEKDKPVTVTLKITMPTKEAIASAIQKLFPFSNLYDIKVSIEEEKPIITPPDENVNVPEAPIDYPPRPLFEAPTRKPEEAPPVKPEG